MAEENENVNIEEQKPSIDLNYINETYGVSLEDEGSLTNVFEEYKKSSEYKSQLETINQEIESFKPYKEKYDTIIEKINSEGFLPDDETLALAQLKQKYKDVDPTLLSQIRNSNLEDKLGALVLANKLHVKSNSSDEARKRAVLKSLGIEGDLSELDGVELEDAKLAIDTAFANKAAELEEIRSFQPKKISLDIDAEIKARQEQQALTAKQKEDEVKSLTDHNTKMFKPILEGFKELTVPYQDEKGKDAEAKYVIDDKFRQEFFEQGVQELTQNGFKITSENAQEVADYINTKFITANWKNVMSSVIRQASTKLAEEYHNATHSDSPRNTTEAPVEKGERLLTVAEQLRNGILKQ